MAVTSNRRPARRVRVAPEQVREQILDAFSARAKAVGHPRRDDGRARDRAAHQRLDALQAVPVQGSAHARVRRALGGRVRRGRRRAADNPSASATASSSSCTGSTPGPTPTPRSRRRSRATCRATTRRRGSASARSCGSASRAAPALLRPVLKPELDERVAFAVLDLILTTVVRPEFADRLRISRHAAIRTAVSIWAGGAVESARQAARAARREHDKGGRQ